MPETNTGGFDSNEIALAKGALSGYAYAAPAGTKLPTDATTALDPAYKGLGYVDNNGVTNANTITATNVTDINGTTVKSEVSAYTETYQFTMLQTNGDTLKVRYGSTNVQIDASGNITAFHATPSGENIILVFELMLGTDRKKRIVVPLAHLTAVGNIQYHASGALGYQVTFTGSPSADINNATSVEYVARLTSSTPSE